MRPEIDLPEKVPVMTLPEVTFFPKVLMPLFIFEPRYKAMLRTSLEGNRMFAVAGIDNRLVGKTSNREPAHTVATVGIIRGCRTREDGTSHLVLQGLSRIHLDRLYEEKPYREATITPLQSTQNVERMVLLEKKSQLLGLIKRRASTHPDIPEELLKLIEDRNEPEDFVDLIAYSLVEDVRLKQTVLDTLAVEDRFDLLIRTFTALQSESEN